MSLKRTWRKMVRRVRGPIRAGITPLAAKALIQADAIVTTNEVSDRHGTGVILDRIFGRAPNVLSIRSTNLYGEHRLGAAHLVLPHQGLTRTQSFARMLYALNGSTVRRILCVQFLPDELISAVVLKELFGAPLCTFLMDDNNCYSAGIADSLMREALNKSSLRLAISPEMRDAYERKYGLKFYVLPPVVRSESVCAQAEPFSGPAQPAAAALVGSIWSRRWLEQLRQTVRQAGLEVHWYGNARAPWLKTSPQQLRRDGILDCGFLPEQELTERLKQYPYALIPSGSLDEHDDRPEIARLSLPTRLPYLLAATHTPMLLLGSRQSAAARFIERFDVGRVVSYDPGELRQAAIELHRPETQHRVRANAARHSPLFSAAGLDQWVWASLEAGEPADARFEQAFARKRHDIVNYLEAPPPADLLGDYVLVYQALKRLQRRGFAPDFVFDVGASTGVWSDVAHRVFPAARFILVEPLHTQYAKLSNWYFNKHPEFECVPAAVSDRAGFAQLNLSPDLYGSSLLNRADSRCCGTVRVPIRTLDEVTREKRVTGRGLLKIDVQFTEHLVLAGAAELLRQTDALIIELSLFRYTREALVFKEMCDLIEDLGFRYYDDVGGWRDPRDGAPLQKDVLFLRQDLFQMQDSPDGEPLLAESESEPVEDVETGSQPLSHCHISR